MTCPDYSLTFNKNEFVQTHWQKQPLVIKQAFSHFDDPISADELAGLALEDDVSSRIVITKPSSWDVVQGPFDDYTEYGDSHWQLLVQAVNHWYPDAQPLVEAFRFLPDWRFDDLMVSFATPQGGVGPHIDNYDVFIIQGEGERRWLVGDIGQHQQRGNDPTSPLVEDFEPIIDVVLTKGDMLYIPPGYPHCGNTLTDMALSYSIGFRAPSQQELLTELADSLIDNNEGKKRFTSNTEPDCPGVVCFEHQQGIMQLLAEVANDPTTFQPMLGKLLSQSRFELDVDTDPEQYDEASLNSAIQQGAYLHRIGGLKVIALENDQQSRLFINGEQYDLEGSSAQTLDLLCHQVSFEPQQSDALLQQACIATLLLSLLNQGLFYLSE